MKAVVLEVHRHECAVMKEDGTFARIPGRYQVGQTIELSDRKEPILGTGSIVRIILVSAALLTSFIGIREYYNTMMPAGYVSFDTDGGMSPAPSKVESVSASPSPSSAPVSAAAKKSESSENAEKAKDQAVAIEYTLNRRNEVIKVVAVNTQAQPTVEKLEAKSVKSRSISDEIERTTSILKESGDISEDETNYVLVSVTGSEEASEVVTCAISDAIDGKDNVELHWVDSTRKDRDEARKLGISTGRYAEIQEITKKTGETDSDDTLLTPALIKTDIDQYKTKTVKELLIDAKAIEKGGTSIAKAQDSKKSTQETSSQAEAGESGKNKSSSQNSTSSEAEIKKAKPTSPVEVGGNDDDNNGTGNGSGGTGNGTSGTNSTGNGTSGKGTGSDSSSTGSTNGTESAKNGTNGTGSASGKTGNTTPAPQTGGNTESSVLHPSTEEIGGGTEEVIAPTPEPTSGSASDTSSIESRKAGEATAGTASTEAGPSTVESAQN